MKITEKKEVNRLAFLLMFTYMISYITRINYGAVISEMERATRISRELLSMAVTGSFITYGTGQIVSGILGDKFSPKKLVSVGFITTILMNILIPLCSNPYQMLAVWCINGFAQSFMWPPIVKIMASSLSDAEYNKAVVKVSWGSSIGTILVYLVSPVMIALFSWKAVFLFSALCGAVMLLIWNRCLNYTEDETKIEAVKEVKEEKKVNSVKILFTPFMICIMIAIILQGMLRDGVTTWMPSYISETYNLSNIISILTGVVLPVFSIVCFNITSKLNNKVFTNPVFCSGVIFGVGAVSALGLYFLSGQNAIFSVALSALLTGCMHGVNLLLICIVPAAFKKYGNVSTVSGVINSCTYIGSAISTYGIALLSVKVGWSNTLLIWFAIALTGTLICFACAKPWEKKMG